MVYIGGEQKHFPAKLLYGPDFSVFLRLEEAAGHSGSEKVTQVILGLRFEQLPLRYISMHIKSH